jgi:hypothetical protein
VVAGGDGHDPGQTGRLDRVVPHRRRRTWERAHLVGTAGLDNFTAYVGQSRARVEPRTWN